MATNEKFNLILQDAVREEFQQKVGKTKKSKKFNRNIDRCRLYGVGYGGKFPKLNKKSLSMSLKDVANAQEKSKLGCTLNRCSSNIATIYDSEQVDICSDPKFGFKRYEHDSFYRWMPLHSKNNNDPERICYNNSFANHDESGGNRPAWYVGYNNNTSVNSAPFACAKRYGFKGAYKLKTYACDRKQNPLKTLEIGMPEYLKDPSPVDEWTPVITANAPSFKGAAMSSMRLWPENCRYVSGYKDGENLPTSAWYRKQTTVNRHMTCPGEKMTKVLKMDDDELTALESAIVLERRANKLYQVDEKGLKTNASMLYDPDSEDMKKLNNSNSSGKGIVTSASHASQHFKNRNKAQGYTYSVDGTILVKKGLASSRNQEDLGFGDSSSSSGEKGNSNSNSNNKKQENRLRNPSFVQFDLKWFGIRHLFDVMLNSRLPGRPNTSTNLIQSLCDQLRVQAEINEAKTMISRDAFIRTLIMKYGSKMEDGKANLIFSTFDPVACNRIHYVNVIACLYIFDRPDDSILEKLMNLWRLYKGHRKDRNIVDNITSLFRTCSASNEETEYMEHVLRIEFIPYCYRVIGLKSPSYKAGSDDYKTSDKLIGSKSSKKKEYKKYDKPQDGKGEEYIEEGNVGEIEEAQPAEIVFNICNDNFSDEDFYNAIKRNKRTVHTFYSQMNARLFQKKHKTDPAEPANRKPPKKTLKKKHFS